ncbi:alpha/beta hydrolase [Microbacterium sp.]|uniref:alpha/beta fold hydrolase n=1 Tax=Microbacterium sp. TaxID=51671 RepID=UPI00281217AF|nr:alpha/beta hydrolase [Microbacterium sp.]
MPVVEDTSEFRYLPGQAAAFGTSTPEASRVSLSLADGRTLSALRYGTGEPEVTFVHGAGLNAHTWDAVVLLLGRPAVVLDLAGHGDSSWRDDADYSPSTLAHDVAAGLQAWAARPQVLVGHSLGGLVAASVAARHPALVRELVLVDVVPGLDTDAAPSILREFYSGATDFASREDAVERAQAFGFGGSRADTERGVFFNTRVRDDGRVEWKHHFAHIIGHAFDALQSANSDATHDPWADLTAVSAPVTLIRGEKGFLQASDVASFERRMPDAAVLTVAAGHNVQETAPASIASLVTEALVRSAR